MTISAAELDYIEETVGKIEDQSPSVTESYRERLYAKIKGNSRR